MWSTTIPYTVIMSIEGEINVNNDDCNDNDDDVTPLIVMIRVVSNGDGKKLYIPRSCILFL